VFPVAAYFIRLGKLKVGSCEFSVTEFTGNVREFSASQQLSEHVADVNAWRRLEHTGTLDKTAVC